MKNEELRIVGILIGSSAEDIISGGDRHALEIWRAWGKFSESGVTVLSCYWGPQLFRKYGYTDLNVFSVERAPSIIGGSRLTYFRRLISAIRSLRSVNDYDAIHSSSMYFYDLLPALILKLRSTQARLIVSIFHLIPPPWRRGGGFLVNCVAWLEQRTMLLLVRQFADHIIVDNAELQEDLERMGIGRARIHLSPMGTNRRTSSLKRDSKQAFDAIYVGRFSHRKGTDDLLRVWLTVANRFPSAVLALVGNEEPGFSVDSLIADLGLAKNVRVFQGLNDEQVAAKFAEARAFITASREEGYGLSVLEALAAGLPCITFEIPAFKMAFPAGRYAAKDLSNGALAEAALELLGDSRLYDRIRGETQLLKITSWDEVASSLWQACIVNGSSSSTRRGAP